MKMNRIKLHKQVETMNKEQLLDLCKSTTSIIDDLQDRIDKAIELLDSYKLGKYDYALTPAGLLELEDILRGKDIKETPKLIGDTPKEDKKIEKLEQKYLNANYVELVDKINEIIDKVNIL